MLGQRLKELRKNRSLTQRELAKELGISASAIGMYEQDRREPDYETLMDICNYFQVSSDFLLDGKPHSTSRELSDMISSLKQTMLAQEGLMFHGVPLNEEDIEKIVEAIHLGASLAIARHKGENGDS